MVHYGLNSQYFNVVHIAKGLVRQRETSRAERSRGVTHLFLGGRVTHLFSVRKRTLMLAAATALSLPAAQSIADRMSQMGPGTEGVPSITAGTLNLTTANNDQATSAFYNTLQTVTNWTSAFTYTKTGGSANPADGFAFVVQSDPRGAKALGSGGGALGYNGGGAITKSVAIGFDIYNGGVAANPTRTGQAFDGSGFSYVNSGDVNLRTGNPIRVNLAYNNGVVTNQTFQRSFNAKIDTRVGTSGFVGFSGGTGGANAAQTISNFTFTTGNAPAAPVLSTPTFLAGGPAGGAGFFGVREVITNGNVGNLDDTQQSLTTERAPTRRIVNYTANSLDIFDSDVRGDFPNDRPFATAASPGPGVGNVDNVALLANGRI